MDQPVTIRKPLNHGNDRVFRKMMLQVSDGSLYAALHKLEHEGWITAGSKTANLGDTEILLAHVSQPPAIGQRGSRTGAVIQR